MGERIFFSKLRKVLASWLLCIKFENARLVIFQIGYGPSHLISMLAVSRCLSPPLSFCWQEYSTTAVIACASVRACTLCVQVGWWEGRFGSPTSALPPLFLSIAHDFLRRRPIHPHSAFTRFETRQMKQQPNPKPNTH